jgi:hypothetical protein
VGGVGGEPAVGGVGGEPAVGGVGGEPAVGGVGGEPGTAGAAGAANEPVNLIFSEYVEGSGGDGDALELFNLGDGTVDLATCEVRAYTNGAATASITRALSGTLAPGAVLVFCPIQNTPAPGYCDLSVTVPAGTGGSGDFSGDDAVALFCGGAAQDIIGEIGFDPGTAWGTGMNTTANHTLRRDCDVTIGDRDGSNDFTPVGEWATFAVNTTADLGTYTCP